ncbi:hypothetical protein ABT084_06415 [Streptomyces sp. NPDC002138]|uniref:hypothetical protein n=1 Tax=Streptomyces sp. NPDC002138 TaxID=3154410 RepID=UPI00332D6F54
MGSGPAPRRALGACAATLLAATLTGCSGPAPDAASGTPPPAATAAPRPTPPEDLCAALITHWAGVVLDAESATPAAAPTGTTGGDGSTGDRDPVGLDYQAMGLSGGQNEILRAVLADARAERRAQGPGPDGPAAARRLAAREARSRCAARYRSGTPTGGPWQ